MAIDHQARIRSDRFAHRRDPRETGLHCCAAFAGGAARRCYFVEGCDLEGAETSGERIARAVGEPLRRAIDSSPIDVRVDWHPGANAATQAIGERPALRARM